jgi:hypothetical protein
MVKGIQTAFAVLILTCLLGVQTVNAQVSSTKLTSLDVLQTSCKTDPQEFLYALRFGPKLGAKTSYKDVTSDVTAVFATAKDANSHFQTEIVAKVDDGSQVTETTNVPTVTPVAQHAVPSGTPSAPVTGGLDPEVLFSMANSYRASLGLPAFQKDPGVCGIAASREPELNAEMATGTLHAGLYNDNHPFWVTENMISMRSHEEAFQWWLNSPVHRGQLQGNFKYACAACSGNTCALVFTNYISK